MIGPEARVERTVCREAEDDGWLVRKVSFPGVNGAPDRVFGKDGRALFIEFKRAGRLPTKQQYRRHAELRVVFGFTVYHCDSIEMGRHLLALGSL